jgi:hypothetical protein
VLSIQAFSDTPQLSSLITPPFGLVESSVQLGIALGDRAVFPQYSYRIRLPGVCRILWDLRLQNDGGSEVREAAARNADDYRLAKQGSREAS